MKRILCCLILLFSFIQAKSQLKEKAPRTIYKGIVEYTIGNFGGYNYPVKGDTVILEMHDDRLMNISVFTVTDKTNIRHTDINFNALRLISKKEYSNIIAPDKIVPTGNYNMKFAYTPNPKRPDNYTVCLTHTGNGATASLLITGESQTDVSTNNILVANLIKQK